MQNTNAYKISQIQEVQQYLAANRIKELYAKLVYEVTLYKPNDAKEYILARLQDFIKHKQAKKQNVFDPSSIGLPDRPKIIFVFGLPGSGKTSVAKAIAEQFDMHYVNVEELQQAQDPQKKESPVTILQKYIEEKKKEQKAPSEFIIDDFPQTIKDALEFEKQITECRFTLMLEGMDKAQLLERVLAGKPVELVEGLQSNFAEKLDIYEKKTFMVVQYFEGLEKMYKFKCDQKLETILQQIRAIFL